MSPCIYGDMFPSCVGLQFDLHMYIVTGSGEVFLVLHLPVTYQFFKPLTELWNSIKKITFPLLNFGQNSS